jgi:hypothetical protein
MSPLAAALRAAADEVPTYDVMDAAIGLGRRRRRRAALASTAAGVVVLALLAFALIPLIGQRGSVFTGESPAGPALPDRIGSPGAFSASVTHSPPGPASVMFTERSGVLTDGDRLVVVGTANDTYRTLSTSRAAAGRTALLSPDGGRIAYSTGLDIIIADLHTGALKTFLSPVTGSDEVVPAVWLADGSGLIVLSTTYADDPTKEGIAKGLGILDISGGYEGFATGTWPIAPHGFTVAVSPDSTRVAYQYSDFITVYVRVSGAKSRITLPDQQTVLAGRGAWTPDGRSLTVVHRDTGDYQARRWELRVLDPATGVERDSSYRPSLAPASVIRLLGWDSRTGHPVVVGFDADQTVEDFGYGGNPLDEAKIQRIGVYELDNGGFRTLLAPTEGITNLDVADSIVAAGLTRPGHPPRTLSPIGLTAVVLAALVLAALAVRRWWRQRAVRSTLRERPR